MRELRIAYGKKSNAKVWKNATITWDALCEKLRTTIKTNETAEEYRSMRRAEKDAVKDKGGFVGATSGTVAGFRRTWSAGRFSRWMQMRQSPAS